MLNFAMGAAHSGKAGQVGETGGEFGKKGGFVLPLVLDDRPLYKGVCLLN